MRAEEFITESAAWQKSSGKNKNGGLNKKGVASYRREHPGSKLQTAVTTKPSKLKKGSKASKRRKSFCARMKGMKKHRTGASTKRDPNSRINKALRKWHCESVEQLYNVLQTLKEAANPAQQAAIAINMKKHHEKPKSESTGDKSTDPGPREFVSNKFYVKFTDDALLIYDGGELVYKRPGNFSNPTRGNASSAKGVTTDLWRLKQNPEFIYTSSSPYIVVNPTNVQRMADKKGIPWNKDRKFLNLLKKLTGKGHLDIMTPEELRTVFDYLRKIKLKENFADGKNPGRKGLAKRSGVNTKASVSSLRNTAKHSSGEKQRMAHWLANMKAGRAKKK